LTERLDSAWLGWNRGGDGHICGHIADHPAQRKGTGLTWRRQGPLRATTEMLSRLVLTQVDYGGCRGPQPLAGEQLIGVPVSGHGLKPACGHRHVLAIMSMLFFLNRFSRSVIAQGGRGRYSRLVQNDSGRPVSQAEIVRADGIDCGVLPPIRWVRRGSVNRVSN